MRLPLMIVAGLLAASGGDPIVIGERPRALPPERDPTPTPRDISCSRCGAQPGEGCDERTLGRYRYHGARVRAFIATGTPTRK